MVRYNSWGKPHTRVEVLMAPNLAVLVALALVDHGLRLVPLLPSFVEGGMADIRLTGTVPSVSGDNHGDGGSVLGVYQMGEIRVGFN